MHTPLRCKLSCFKDVQVDSTENYTDQFKKDRYGSYQYTHKTVDAIYDAFLVKDSAKDSHVPSKVSLRAKEMPTYSIYKMIF